MIRPSEFFKKLSEAEYTAKVQEEVKEYDRLAQAHYSTCEEELTGDKLLLLTKKRIEAESIKKSI